MSIPLFDISSATAPLRDRFEAAFRRVLASGTYILGHEVASFERELAAYLGVRHVVGVANGTDAITIALLALGVGPGDEVVVPSFTFFASAEAIVPTGATPVFCDVDLDTACVSTETVRAALTRRTKAIIAVDLFGNPAPADELERELGIPVVEDAAQAAGSTLRGKPAGSLGRLATFSFYPSKNLGCLGDGGAIATDDEELADRARLLRAHGSRDGFTYQVAGYNSRLDELQAAMLRICLPELDAWAAARREVDRLYRECGLEDHVTVPVAAEGSRPAWHLFVIRHERREAIARALQAAGIGHRVYYRAPIHRQPAMLSYGADADLAATEDLVRTHLAIPISPTMSVKQVEEVVSVIGGVCSGHGVNPPAGAQRD